MGERNSFKLTEGRNGELGHVLGPGWGEHLLFSIALKRREGQAGGGMAAVAQSWHSWPDASASDCSIKMPFVWALSLALAGNNSEWGWNGPAQHFWGTAAL